MIDMISTPHSRTCTRTLMLCFLLPALLSTFAGGLQAETMSLTLREAIDLAVTQSPSVQVAALRIEQAEAASDQVKSRLLPQVSLNLNSGYQGTNLKTLGLSLPNFPERADFQFFDLRPVVTQNVYDPSTRKEFVAARERAGESKWDAETVKEALRLSVSETYLAALDYNARLDAANAQLRTAQALLQQTRQFVEAGTASHLDEDRAEIQVANERRNITELQSKMEVKKLLLANVLGVSPGTELQLTDIFDPPADGTINLANIFAEAVENRPEMRAYQARLRAAAADKEKAEKSRYPTFGFTADFGRTGNSVANNISTYTVRGGVQVPILQGGRIKAEVRSAEAGIRRTEEEIRSLTLQIETDVRAAVVEVNAAREAHRLAAQAVDLARRVLDLASARYAGALTSNIEVVNAQESLASAQSTAIRCVFDYFSARARLARARGDVRTLFESIQ